MLLSGLQPGWDETAFGATPAKVWTLADADLEPADPDILGMYHAQVASLNAQGVATHAFPLPRPLAEYQRLCGDIMAFDAFQALRLMVMDHRLPMDPWVRHRIIQGRTITREDRQAAEAVRAQDIALFRERFGPDDVLFLPGTPFPPRQVAEIDETEIRMSRFTRIANYLDLCAVTVPLAQSGRTPFGLQFIAQTGGDDLLLSSLLPDNLFDHLDQEAQVKPPWKVCSSLS